MESAAGCEGAGTPQRNGRPVEDQRSLWPGDGLGVSHNVIQAASMRVPWARLAVRAVASFICAAASTAIYTDRLRGTHIIRRIMVRTEKWLNYIF